MTPNFIAEGSKVFFAYARDGAVAHCLSDAYAALIADLLNCHAGVIMAGDEVATVYKKDAAT